ncbi:MAG: hypothetical protein NTZ21_10410 [Actinobacteria bacterium]|nr:hypothetical protein [Actinomycetota bacterium]
MRTRPSLAGASVLALLLLTACGGDDDSAGTADASTTVAVETAAPAPTTSAASVTPAPSDTADLPVGTGDIPLPVGTGDIPPLPPVTSDLPYSLSVTVGLDADPERIERVPLGATIALSVTNPDSEDEFHLHGYDLGDGQVMPAGQTATFTFVANQAGSFELESHETGAVLMVLEVV